ncbi:TetR/AcrR family transcriptional regulator [Actinomadura scrupuli]|uniref:TetR/AcrR family transcriptional regulator n=1 Tax=Actinomadura scrupuli TaxID=559629 RepID=UPI003D9984EE
MSTRPPRRGPYAKGVARRQEVLEVALEVLAANGLRHSSLEDIATRAGLTRPGLLHYFGTREELLVSVLRARHERDIEQAAQQDSPHEPLAARVVSGVLRQHRSPGLVRLDAAMAAEATDPAHPAHLYFRQRSRRLEHTYARAIANEIAAGRVSPDIDCDLGAQQLNSLIDGLHVQWLIDPGLDVRAILTSALRLLLPPPR